MAKLEGVKVLDMKYGEILRVEYNGEIYEKVDGPAQKGDLALRIKAEFNVDITPGSFYRIIDVDGCDVKVSDDVGDIENRSANRFKFFRKISVQPSLADRVAAVEAKFNDLESRVDKLEGKTDDDYRLVTNREPRVGDFVKFDEAPCGWLTAGKYYEIVDIDYNSELIIKDDDGDYYNTAGDEFEVYEKVTEDKSDKQEIKVGDFVRLISNGRPCYGWGDASKGDVGKVTEINGEELFIDFPNHKDWHGLVSEVEKVWEEFTPTLKSKDRPTVGDFVKVIQNGIHQAKIGDYAKIVENDKSDIPFKCEDLNGWNVGWFREDEVEKVTDENELKFLRAGRKPNEYKVGDLIQITKYEGGAPVGSIREVREVYNTFVLYSDLYGAKFDAISLVAPVEARVDRP